MSRNFIEPSRTGRLRNYLKIDGFCDVIGLYWTWLDKEMVEAAGVEPASGNTPLTYLHA